jgi:U3 small nucleolar RNA-associated protein 4
LYKISKDELVADKEVAKEQVRKWVYVGYVRSHTHDVRALTMAVPICREGLCLLSDLPFIKLTST